LVAIGPVGGDHLGVQDVHLVEREPDHRIRFSLITRPKVATWDAQVLEATLTAH
jgi:hypothetical protein